MRSEFGGRVLELTKRRSKQKARKPRTENPFLAGGS